jgi:hypothetical protein
LVVSLGNERDWLGMNWLARNSKKIIGGIVCSLVWYSIIQASVILLPELDFWWYVAIGIATWIGIHILSICDRWHNEAWQ